MAGQLQATGRQAAARVLKTEFTDEADTLVLDFASAYRVKELKKLERTFVFSREGRGKLTVTDEVEFEQPADVRHGADHVRQVETDGGRTVCGLAMAPMRSVVEIHVDGGEFQIVPETIHEQLPQGRVPVRLGIELTKPVAAATIRVRMPRRCTVGIREPAVSRTETDGRHAPQQAWPWHSESVSSALAEHYGSRPRERMPSTTRVTAMSIAAWRIGWRFSLGTLVDLVERARHALVQPLFHLVAGHLVALRFLGVFEIGNEHAAGVAEDVGDDEDARGR